MQPENCRWCGKEGVGHVVLKPARQGKNYRQAVTEPICESHARSFEQQGAEVNRTTERASA